jgi:hypothetical protein
MSERESQFMAKTPTALSDLERLSHHDSQLVVMDSGGRWPVGLMLCTLAFLACILLTVTPLSRMPDPVLHHLRIGWGAFLGEASQWLPANLGSTYQRSSAAIEFFCLLTLAFCCYCLGLWLVGRWTDNTRRWPVNACIWLGLILAGAIYLVTPGVREHDIEAYAGYSRLLGVYHANPYFTTLWAFPHDPVLPTDVWSGITSAYGPVWMLVCALLGWLLKQPTPEAYIIGFRVVALAAHLLNTWLVYRVLRALGRSPRVCSLGMLLYGWSPLVLIDSAQDAHLDLLMLTFVLLGILLAVQAEQRGELLRARGYLPPILALTLAALVKYTILPVLVAFLLLLACKAMRPTAASPLTWREAFENWRTAVALLCLGCLASVLLALAFYGPFWFGHSPDAIITSFNNNPVATWAENSIMRSLIWWWHFHPEQKGNPLLLFFSQRRVWNVINYLAIALCLVIGTRRLWKTPTVSVFLTLVLAMMSLVLLLTPWFFAWYITWIVVLAAVSLPARRSRVLWAFFFLALTFSYSALTLYLFHENLLDSHGYLDTLVDAGPPICVFLFCWLYYPRLRMKAKPLDSGSL